MISVVIPVAQEEPGLLDTLAALVPAVADGLVRDLVLVSSAPNRFAEDVADASGCGILVTPGARAAQLAASAAVLRAPWILALEPGLVPAGGWMDEIADFMSDSGQAQRACAFTLVPRAGGAYPIAERAFGPTVGFFTGSTGIRRSWVSVAEAASVNRRASAP